MYYKNGREAKNGDKVICFPSWGPPLAGILYDAVAGNDYCNGKIAVVSGADPCPNLQECLHADDVAAAVTVALDTAKAAAPVAAPPVAALPVSAPPVDAPVAIAPPPV